MYAGPKIDCDVHHNWKSREDMTQYLPKVWREFADGPVLIEPAYPTHPNRHGHNKRVDSFPPDGSVPGSDYETLRAQVLDEFDVSRAILLYDTGTNSGHPNIYFATELVRAMNRWSIDYWLDGRDDRLYGGLLVPTQQPEEAAKEIMSVGENPRMATVLLNWNPGKPFGHPFYHPIYEAAQSMELPIAIHIGVTGSGPWFAGGMPSGRVEFHTLLAEPMQHHLTSFITHGVFERFPRLKLIMIETGIAWIPWLMWRLDADYALLKRESPWVKRLPSEYFREHCALSTQPLDESPRRQQLLDVLGLVDGFEDMLCFATDYPHWDADDPLYIARKLPSAWQEKVFWSNAERMFRWPAAAPGKASLELAGARGQA